MPLPDHLEYVPDAPKHQGGLLRPKQDGNRCPECGRDLSGMDSAKHALEHYPARWDPNNPPSAQAIERKDALMNMGKPAQERQMWP